MALCKTGIPVRGVDSVTSSEYTPTCFVDWCHAAYSVAFSNLILAGQLTNDPALYKARWKNRDPTGFR